MSACGPFHGKVVYKIENFTKPLALLCYVLNSVGVWLLPFTLKMTFWLRQINSGWENLLMNHSLGFDFHIFVVQIVSLRYQKIPCTFDAKSYQGKSLALAMNKPTVPRASSPYHSHCINYTTLAPGFYGSLSCITPYYSLMGQAVHMPSHSV